jgi:hypothetical protein
VFTKVDIFAEKLALSGQTRTIELMQRIWPAYDGNGSYDDTLSYIRQQFITKSDPARVRGTYVVNIFDTDTVLATFQSIMELVEHLPPQSTKE